VRRAVEAGSRPSGSYFLMNAAATLIAGFGLLADSDAVIIGAMLIAMLYGPILAIGFALAELDRQLLGRALRVELAGAIWVFLIGFLIGWFNAEIPIGNQLLARTAPNILDLLIALVGGAAGAYAMASTRVSGAVVGVAIATALCPPLTACGILAAHGLPQLAVGALLLFFTNLTAIATAAMIVFLLMGHGAGWKAGPGWSTRIVPLVVIVGLSAYLLRTFHQVVDDASLRNRITSVLEKGLGDYPGARIVEVRLASEQGRRIAFGVVRTPNAISSETVGRLDDAVDLAAGRDISLHLRVILVHELTRAESKLPPETERALRRR
jgi:uncharacterized hydrophobic protein (TIGR00271 family)